MPGSQTAMQFDPNDVSQLFLPLYPFLKRIEPMEFYTYSVHIITANQNIPLASTCHTALRSLNKKHANKHYRAYTDKEKIYSLKELDEPDCDFDFQSKDNEPYVFQLVPEGKQLLPLSTNLVYESYLKELVLEAFRSIPTYRIQNGDVYTPKIVMGFEQGTNIPIQKELLGDKGRIRMDRKIIIDTHVLPDGRAYLQLDYSSEFVPKESVYEMVKSIGVEALIQQHIWVKYTLPTQTYFSGYIVPMPVDPQNEWYSKKREGFLKHYRGTYTAPEILEAVDQDPEDDIPLALQQKNGRITPFLSYFLVRVLSKEIVRNLDPAFSRTATMYEKLNMQKRFQLDYVILDQLGTIPELGVKLSKRPAKPAELGFQATVIAPPTLKAGKHSTVPSNWKKNFFNQHLGYYKQPHFPDEKFRLAILIPAPFQQENDGFFSNLTRKCFVRYLLSNGLLESLPVSRDEVTKFLETQVFTMPDSLSKDLDVEFFLSKIQKEFAAHAYVVAVPATDGKGEGSLYSMVKGRLSQKNVPTQMVEEATMKSICVTKYIEVLNQFRVKNPDYATTLENVRKKYGAFYDTSDRLIAQNLNMGILSKLSGVPFAISNMKGNVDLYIGIDVGTATNGIHYPACSVAFTKDGSFLGFVQPVDAIPGEKIPPDVLRKLLTEILVAYREKYQEYPKSVVIHRDGFSHEDSSIYSDFFEKEGIKVSVFEIRKVGAPRIMNRNNQDGQNRNYKYAWNPVKGTLLFREDEAFLVTTEAKAGGAPKTIHIVKKYGDINIQTAAEQIYALTKIDASSIWDTRLPVTIKFADAVCKQRKYLPKGIVDNRLLFL